MIAKKSMHLSLLFVSNSHLIEMCVCDWLIFSFEKENSSLDKNISNLYKQQEAEYFFLIFYLILFFDIHTKYLFCYKDISSATKIYEN